MRRGLCLEALHLLECLIASTLQCQLLGGGVVQLLECPGQSVLELPQCVLQLIGDPTVALECCSDLRQLGLRRAQVAVQAGSSGLARFKRRGCSLRSSTRVIGSLLGFFGTRIRVVSLVFRNGLRFLRYACFAARVLSVFLGPQLGSPGSIAIRLGLFHGLSRLGLEQLCAGARFLCAVLRSECLVAVRLGLSLGSDGIVSGVLRLDPSSGGVVASRLGLGLSLLGRLGAGECLRFGFVGFFSVLLCLGGSCIGLRTCLLGELLCGLCGAGCLLCCGTSGLSGVPLGLCDVLLRQRRCPLFFGLVARILRHGLGLQCHVSYGNRLVLRLDCERATLLGALAIVEGALRCVLCFKLGSARVFRSRLCLLLRSLSLSCR